MSIRSHDLARAAYGVVSARQQLPDDERKKYGALAHKLPSLILQNGLAQATGFLLAKGKNIQATDKDAETETAVDNPSTRPNEHYALLDDLREILHAVRVINSNVTERDDLHKQIIDADMATTMRLTRHSLAACGWIKRYVQGILRIDSTGAVNDANDAKEDDHAD